MPDGEAVEKRPGLQVKQNDEALSESPIILQTLGREPSLSVPLR